ncbi:MAG: hypothetical protein R2844_10480 [Caldilineales bacterium]
MKHHHQVVEDGDRVQISNAPAGYRILLLDRVAPNRRAVGDGDGLDRGVPRSANNQQAILLPGERVYLSPEIISPVLHRLNPG